MSPLRRRRNQQDEAGPATAQLIGEPTELDHGATDAAPAPSSESWDGTQAGRTPNGRNGLPEDWAQLLRTMIVVRSFDDEVGTAFSGPDDDAAGDDRGLRARFGAPPPPRCNEGMVAVLGSLLRPGDTVVASEPAHLAVLAGGAPLAATLAELLGSPRGLCGGTTGPGQLADAERAAFGLERPIGRSLRLALGAALAAQQLRRQGVVVAVAGPVAAASPAAVEALDLAAIWRLPLVVVLTRRNGDAPVTTPATDAGAIALEQVRVDRDDVLAVRAGLQRVIERARAGEGPALVDALSTVASTADGAGVPADPILRLALAVLRAGEAVPEALDELRDRSRAEVRAARDLVESWMDGGAEDAGAPADAARSSEG